MLKNIGLLTVKKKTVISGWFSLQQGAMFYACTCTRTRVIVYKTSQDTKVCFKVAKSCGIFPNYDHLYKGQYPSSNEFFSQTELTHKSCVSLSRSLIQCSLEILERHINIKFSPTSCNHVGFEKSSFEVNMMVDQSFVLSGKHSFRDLLTPL